MFRFKGDLPMKTRDEIFKFIQATLNLFKAIPKLENEYVPKYILANEKNLESGFFVTIQTFQDCPYVASTKISDFIKDKYGYDIYEFNQNLHQSINKVANFTPKEALFDKLWRYLSRYGMERLGKFERDFVYIPNETFNFPENAAPMKIFIVGSISESEIKKRVAEMLNSGADLREDKINSLVEVIHYLNIEFEIDDVSNKKLFIKLCERLKILPKNPVQFLRHIIYIGTGSPLLIKNAETVENLRKSQTRFDDYFVQYINENGIENLASVFHRFKPLWLAFKSHSKYLRTTINRIRKFADHYHKPTKPDFLACLTSAENIDLNQLQIELSKLTTYKKVSLANALLYRLATPENSVYHIRNSKTFVTDYFGKSKAGTDKILNVIVNSIVDDIKFKVRGKKIYIPENFTYAMPVNEKHFIGNIPYGSCYAFNSRSCIVGVHWINILKNNDEIRVDLDLHLNGIGKNIDVNFDFSKNNLVNARDHKVIFSGDMTDAPLDNNGAMEAFFIGETLRDKFMILNVNHYNRELFRLYKKHKNPPVPFNLVFADVEKDKFDQQYLTHSYEFGFCVPCKMETGAMFLGFIVASNNGKKKFYFSSRNVSTGVVAKTAALNEKFTSAICTSFENCLSLNEVLEKAGAILNNVDKSNCDIDLDPFDFTKDTLLELIEK